MYKYYHVLSKLIIKIIPCLAVLTLSGIDLSFNTISPDLTANQDHYHHAYTLTHHEFSDENKHLHTPAHSSSQALRSKRFYSKTIGSSFQLSTWVTQGLSSDQNLHSKPTNFSSKMWFIVRSSIILQC